MFRFRVVALLLLFAGCRPPAPSSSVGCGVSPPQDPLAVTVADAQLDDVTMWQAGLAFGHAEGDATLLVHDDDGNDHEFDARLDGSSLGLVADASLNATFGVPYTFTLPVGTAVTIRQLLGSYEGAHVGLDLGVGGQWRNLQNTSKVALNITSMSFGLGATPVTWDTLDLELWDDPIDDAEPPPGCTDQSDGVCDSTCIQDPDC